MKNRTLVTGAFAVVAVCASASPSEAAVDRTQFRGNSADFSTFDSASITCVDGTEGFVDTSLFIQAFAAGVRSTFGNSDTETLFLFFSQFNSCTGEGVSAFVFDDAAEFEQNRLQSASISGEFELIDFNGTSAGTVLVDLDLTGVGDTTRQNSHSVTQSGDFLFNSRFSGTFRQATPSGSISVNGEDLSITNGFAQLTKTRSGNITVTH